MIDAHRGAFEYDWRARFHLSLTVVGESMTWGEAIRLTHLLSRDPSSQVAAAALEWPHPLSREALILLDQYDLAGHANWGKKHEPHPMRPRAKKPTSERRGKEQVLSQDEILAALRAAGHNLPDPGSTTSDAEEVTRDG